MEHGICEVAPCRFWTTISLGVSAPNTPVQLLISSWSSEILLSIDEHTSRFDGPPVKDEINIWLIFIGGLIHGTLIFREMSLNPLSLTTLWR